ncbi:hypothetical protein PI86_06125 [Burkholderia sp. A9]|nr:hypothetical protein PI86_06125 [Burkholderia sp. A9]
MCAQARIKIGKLRQRGAIMKHLYLRACIKAGDRIGDRLDLPKTLTVRMGEYVDQIQPTGPPRNLHEAAADAVHDSVRRPPRPDVIRQITFG